MASLVVANSGLSEEVQRIAEKMREDFGIKMEIGCFASVAEAQLDILMVRRARLMLFNTRAARTGDSNRIEELVPALARLDRYERRAFSRRRRAMRAIVSQISNSDI